MTLAPPRPGPDSSRRDLSAPWRHVDVVLLVCTLAVAVLGVVLVYSATKGPVEVDQDTSFLVRQGAFMVVGFVLMGVVALIDYHKLRDWAAVIYGGACLLLLLVVSPLGSSSKGAQAWFALGPFQFQPSELSKLALVVALGALLAAWKGDVDLRRLGLALLLAGVPLALIMLQPDLGTALVYIAIVMAMLLVGGVKARHVLALTLVGVIGVWGVLHSNVLKDYQKDRLTVFLDADNPDTGAAYNVNQAMIAIQRGGVWGDGLFNGKQTQLDFVPEKQTDFVFTVAGEELGFVGAGTLLALLGVIVWRCWRTAQLARDGFGQLLCVGVLAMLVFQIFENVGMTMGIMPVTGIPLPFVSYGGSTTLTTFIAIGLVQSVHMRRFR